MTVPRPLFGRKEPVGFPPHDDWEDRSTPAEGADGEKVIIQDLTPNDCVVALIVEAWPWTPPPPRRRQESLVLVKVAFPEKELRRQIKDVGGVWHPDKQAWAIRYDRAIA